MPKDRRVNSLSSNQSRVSPYSCGSRDSNSKNLETSSPASSEERDWEEARCPICMEHPHNAVLLNCSSRDRGCRPYMCDTSYRHSNCLDQFRKSFPAVQAPAQPDNGSVTWMLYRNGGGTQTSSQPNRSPVGQSLEVACPLCRGQITGWVVVETARKYMNAKVRSCSMESCDFTGNYAELRKHARSKHPSVRPSESDPQRQSDWARLERQRDLADTLSAYRSQFDMDEDDSLEWYDMNQDDGPFEEQWLTGLFDNFFSGVHSESEYEQREDEDEQREDDDMSINLYSEVEFSFSFLDELFVCPWDDGRRSFGNARTGNSLLNRRSTRSRSSIDFHRETSRQSRNETDASRHRPSSSQPTDYHRETSRRSRNETGPSRHTPNSLRQTDYHRETSRRSQNETQPSRYTPNSLRPGAPSRHAPSSSRPSVPSRHSPISSPPSAPSRHTPSSSLPTAPSRHESSSSQRQQQNRR